MASMTFKTNGISISISLGFQY